jgi:hypothetical protein
MRGNNSAVFERFKEAFSGQIEQKTKKLFNPKNVTHEASNHRHCATKLISNL